MRVIITSLFTIYVLALSVAQDIEFEIPVKLGTTVNSESEESSVLLSSNGKRLYFARIMETENTGGLSGGQDVWFCDKKGEGWSEASNILENINNKGNNAIIGMSDNGNTIYLLNKYKGKSTTMGASYAIKEGDGWSVPQAFNIPVQTSNTGYYGFNMDSKGKIVIISMSAKSSLGKEDLYVSFNNGNTTWSSPIHLGDVINSEGFETTPFITDDGRKLYFSSDGHGGFGNADIFVSERLDNSWTNWTKPVNLGEKINSLGFDASFSIWRDSLVYFCSNRSGIMNDIFQSKLVKKKKISEELQEIVNLANNTLADLNELMAVVSIQVKEGNNAKMLEEDESVITKKEELRNQFPTITELEIVIAATEKLVEMTPELLVDTIVEPEASKQKEVEVDTADEEDPIKSKEGITASIEEFEVEPEIKTDEAAIEIEDLVAIKPNLEQKATDEEVITTEKEVKAEINVGSKPEDEKETISEHEEVDSKSDHAELTQPIKNEHDLVAVAKAEAGSVVVDLAEGVPAKEKNVTEDVSELAKVNYISRTSLNQVYFNHNSSYLNDAAKELMAKLSVKLMEQSYLKLEVLAFADNLGEDLYNMWISERRANRVIDYLLSKGIVSSRLTGKWFGENNPVVKCAECTEDQHQMNRRVELIME